MALSTSYRKTLSPSDFAIPSKAPGPGSYPIQTMRQAMIAHALAAMHGEESPVDAAIRRKYGRVP